MHGAGIRESAPEEKVKEAHRRIMIANHPDAGGSSFVAAKVGARGCRTLGGVAWAACLLGGAAGALAPGGPTWGQSGVQGSSYVHGLLGLGWIDCGVQIGAAWPPGLQRVHKIPLAAACAQQVAHRAPGLCKPQVNEAKDVLLGKKRGGSSIF